MLDMSQWLVRSQTSRFKVEPEDAVNFTLQMAQALQRRSLPAHRIENTMERLNDRLGMNGRFYSSGGMLLASFGDDANQRTFILKVPAGEVDLEKLDQLDSVAASVASGQMTPHQGISALAMIEATPDRYPGWLNALCFMLSSGGAARLFGGGWREVLIGALIGLMVGVMVESTARFRSLGSVLTPLCAFLAMLVAINASLVLGPFSLYISTVTGLIVLIPGMSLTTALTEMATGHPVSGTARLSNAMVVFLMMGFGVALAAKLMELAGVRVTNADPVNLPVWTQWLALLLASSGFLVLFRAKPSDIGWVISTVLLAFFGARFGNQFLGTQLGGSLASFAVTIGGTLFSRSQNRPASIFMVPGVMLLVPGSLGYRSMSALLAHDTLQGLETAFTMTLVAISLVAGFVAANFVLPPKRDL